MAFHLINKHMNLSYVLSRKFTSDPIEGPFIGWYSQTK